MTQTSLKYKIQKVKDEIYASCLKVGRDPNAVKLVAATKGVPALIVNEAIQLGITDIGENRLQEAIAKMPDIVGKPDWHFLGHLQTNKVNQVVGRFKIVHSVDSIRLLSRINQAAQRLGLVQPCFLSVNVTKENSKFGLYDDEVDDFVHQAASFKSIYIKGLMTIAAYSDNKEDARPCFIRLRKIGERLSDFDLQGLNITEYSMGMSSDYTVAVEEGATIVRVGSAIFGERRQT